MERFIVGCGNWGLFWFNSSADLVSVWAVKQKML